MKFLGALVFFVASAASECFTLTNSLICSDFSKFKGNGAANMTDIAFDQMYLSGGGGGDSIVAALNASCGVTVNPLNLLAVPGAKPLACMVGLIGQNFADLPKYAACNPSGGAILCKSSCETMLKTFNAKLEELCTTNSSFISAWRYDSALCAALPTSDCVQPSSMKSDATATSFSAIMLLPAIVTTLLL